jgi:hypothetical protein
MKKYKIDCAVAFTIAEAAVIELNVSESKSVVSLSITGAVTLNLSADAKPSIGDELILQVANDATIRTLTFGTGITAPNLVGVANKTKVQSFVYDGTAFVATAAPVQID